MSITDELRKEARGFGRYVYTAPQADCLTAIANRIDAEHEAACAEAYGNGVMSVPIALDESQWVKLPKDADGVPIRAGDTLDGYGKTIEVVEMRYGRGGWVLISRDGSGYADTFAFAHHHEPTVEDVMCREAADTIWELRDDLQRANAENAKLREQMERLVTLLRVDCDIDASWDGLRRFWSIGLTEYGCLMRDRACKAEAENAKLRELVRIAGTYCVNGYCGKDDGCPLYLGKPYCALPDCMRELGIEVDG